MMNRKVLDLISILAVLFYMEINHWQFVIIEGPVNLLRTFSIILLGLPFISVFVRINDFTSNKAYQNALVVSVNYNQLTGHQISERSEVVVNSNFSDAKHIITCDMAFEKAMNELIKKQHNAHKLTLAPYVILKTKLDDLTNLEKKGLIIGSDNAGAVKTIVVDCDFSDSDLGETIKSNPIENFA